MALASFGPSSNYWRHSGNFWAAHSHFLQPMDMHKGLNLALDPFWPLLPQASQQDRYSHPEQHLANIFPLGSQEELSVQMRTAGVIISHCCGQRRHREQLYKGPIIHRPGSGTHVGSVQDLELPVLLIISPYLVTVRVMQSLLRAPATLLLQRKLSSQHN